jgi:hypothetical protein
LGERRRYEIVKRLGERPDALACCAVRDCMPPTPQATDRSIQSFTASAQVTENFQSRAIAQEGLRL